MDLTNLEFSVPFDEDDKDKTVWFLDHDYLEQMSSMFKKVNGRNFHLPNLKFGLELNVFISSSRKSCWMVSHRTKASPK